MRPRRVNPPRLLPWKVRAAGFLPYLDPVTRSVELYHLPPREDDPTVSFKPVTKKTAIRFAVGRPGQCSSVFRVWANRDKFDVYASIRSWKDLAKYSFHESGTYVYHLSSTEHENAKWVSLPDLSNRRIHSWTRPEPFVPGWTHLITFMVPTEDVRPNVNAGWDDPDKVRWISKPNRNDTVTEFRVLVGDPGMPLVDVGASNYLLDAGIIDGFVLCNDQIVVVTMHVTRLDAKGRRMLRALRREITDQTPSDFILDGKLAPRFASPNIQSDGRHALWDLSPEPSSLIG